ncbi:hypothetical protein [Enterococcus casseliflavus]|uniref:hypothetical protein n=1 Tax=Enterococcus casseliflavus TaxID=37734 RepID=UPI003D0D6DC5
MELISAEGKERIKSVYRDVCIAENAYRNDVGGHNGNFEQRKIAIDDVFQSLGMIHEARYIEEEISGQSWTRSRHVDGRIRYELVQ